MTLFLRRQLCAILVCILVASSLLAQQNPAASALPQNPAQTPGANPHESHEAAPQDAVEIIRRSVSRYQHNLDVARDYVFQKREVEQELDKHGKLKKASIRSYDILMIYGEPYEKLTAKDDKPLDAHDQEKEEKRLNEFYERKKKEHESESASAKAREKREREERKLATELPEAMDFQLVGEDVIDGQPVYVITAAPKPGYKPNDMIAKLLTKLRGKIWITQADYQWARMEVDLLDDFSVGLFLFKLHKGAHLEFEQTRINDEVWLPRRAAFNGAGRILMKNEAARLETTFSNYQKFKANARIVGFSEAPGVGTDQR